MVQGMLWIEPGFVPKAFQDEGYFVIRDYCVHSKDARAGDITLVTGMVSFNGQGMYHDIFRFRAPKGLGHGTHLAVKM